MARQSIDHAKRQQHDIVIIDTAGRLGIDQEMMRQAADIRDAVSPDEVLFVVDAMIGQDAVTTAQAFMEGVGFDGVVLTKLDGDARGGAALSVRHITGRPIMFASTGEKLEDFDAFHPDRMASRILDMGDILTLIEQAQKTFDEEQAAKMAGKLTSGEGFTLEDFLEQMMMVQKMGPIKNLLGMMPGMGQMREQLNQIDDRDLDRVAAIIRSMTPGERQNPKIINGSRRARIAKGSGVTVTEVSNLVTRFFDAQKMMKRMAGGMGIPGMPGEPQGGQGRAEEGGQGAPGQRRPAQGGAGQGGSDSATPRPSRARAVSSATWAAGSFRRAWSCRRASTPRSSSSPARSDRTRCPRPAATERASARASAVPRPRLRRGRAAIRGGATPGPPARAARAYSPPVLRVHARRWPSGARGRGARRVPAGAAAVMSAGRGRPDGEHRTQYGDGSGRGQQQRSQGGCHGGHLAQQIEPPSTPDTRELPRFALCQPHEMSGDWPGTAARLAQ